MGMDTDVDMDVDMGLDVDIDRNMDVAVDVDVDVNIGVDSNTDTDVNMVMNSSRTVKLGRNHVKLCCDVYTDNVVIMGFRKITKTRNSAELCGTSCKTAAFSGNFKSSTVMLKYESTELLFMNTHYRYSTFYKCWWKGSSICFIAIHSPVSYTYCMGLQLECQ